MNIKSMGATPIPVGFIGNDAGGTNLKKILEENAITTDHLVAIDDFKTPRKSRILSGGENTKKQQVLRIDTLNRNEVKENFYKKVEEFLSEQLKGGGLLIISDYLNKSVKPFVFEKIREIFPDKIIIIDSRNNLLEFNNITIATPNEPELKKIFPEKKFLSTDDFINAGMALLNRINAKGIVLKRGHRGVVVFEENKKPEMIEIHGSSDIVDVTGAGDTVISLMGLSLSAGADLITSARLANIAAGVVVMKEGAYPIRIHELQNELQ